MLAFTGGFNKNPVQWESKATKLFGQELSNFIKTGSLRLGFFHFSADPNLSYLGHLSYIKSRIAMKMRQSFNLESTLELKILKLKYQ